MFQQGLTDTLSATEIRQSIDQTQERTKRSTAGSSAHGFSCSRRLSPLSGRNSTYRLVQISGTGSNTRLPSLIGNLFGEDIPWELLSIRAKYRVHGKVVLVGFCPAYVG